MMRAAFRDGGLDKTYLAPPGVPAEKVRMLREAFSKALQDPEVKTFLKERGAVSPAVSGAELQNDVVPRLLGVSDETVDTVKTWLGR